MTDVFYNLWNINNYHLLFDVCVIVFQIHVRFDIINYTKILPFGQSLDVVRVGVYLHDNDIWIE